MKTNWKQLAVFVLVLPAIVASGCASGDIDDPDSPPNVLQVAVTESPPVQGTRDSTTGACLFTITEWEARFNNEPKNELAVNSPMNDFFVERFVVNYSWPGAAVVVPPQRELPSPGTVAPGSEQSIKFEPILLQDFDPAMEGTTGILDMVVQARYADGTRVTLGLQESLVVSSCQ